MKKEKENSDERPEGHRSWNYVFAKINDGDSHREASAEMHGLIANLQQLSRMKRGGAKGKIVITMALNVDSDLVDIRCDVSVVKEKPKRTIARCWVTKGGNVAFEDPRQGTLPNIREVPASENDVQEAHDPETGEVLEAK